LIETFTPFPAMHPSLKSNSSPIECSSGKFVSAESPVVERVGWQDSKVLRMVKMGSSEPPKNGDSKRKLRIQMRQRRQPLRSGRIIIASSAFASRRSCKPNAKTRGFFKMRNRTTVIFSALGIIALLALAPNPAAARGGFGFHGGGFGGFRGGGFAGARAMNIGGFRGGALVGRPGWGAVRPGWGGGWRGGWGRWGGGWGWGWPVAAGVGLGIAAATAPWGWGYGGSCTYWNGFAWVNACYGPDPYAWGW